MFYSLCHNIYFIKRTSVAWEQVWTQKCAVQKASVVSIFHIINLKKKIMDTRVLDLFNKKSALKIEQISVFCKWDLS
jgi:hypothetical protein